MAETEKVRGYPETLCFDIYGKKVGWCDNQPTYIRQIKCRTNINYSPDSAQGLYSYSIRRA
jgi:hypothetical protein